MIELLLVRHGNTFAPGDRIVWVGKGEDLPLVESGRAQAEALAAALHAAGWRPTAAVSGGLRRQVEHLRLATGGAPEPVETDALDYFPDRETMVATAEKITPMGRIGQPDDIACAVELLCLPQARWITGQVLVADGGVSIV